MAGSPKRKIQLRRGDSSQWVSANPVLSQGEPGYDTTTGALKVGDGLNAWTDLAGLGGGTTNEPFIPLSVGVVGADPVVINEAGTYWLVQAAPYIDGVVTVSLAPPETDDNVKVRLMYDSNDNVTGGAPLIVFFGTMFSYDTPCVMVLPGQTAEFMHFSITVPGYGTYASWMCTGANRRASPSAYTNLKAENTTVRNQYAKSVSLSNSGSYMYARIGDGVFVVEDEHPFDADPYSVVNVLGGDVGANEGQRLTIVNNSRRSTSVVSSDGLPWYNGNPHSSAYSIHPGCSATFAYGLYRPDWVTPPTKKLICVSRSGPTYNAVDVAFTGSSLSESAVSYGTEGLVFDTDRQNPVQIVYGSVNPVVFDFEAFVPYTVASGRNATFMLDLERDDPAPGGARIDSFWEYQDGSGNPKTEYKSSNTPTSYVSGSATIRTSQNVPGGGRKLLRITGTISIRALWFDLSLKYTEELSGGAGVVVHKECKLRVRQPEFGGGWT